MGLGDFFSDIGRGFVRGFDFLQERVVDPVLESSFGQQVLIPAAAEAATRKVRDVFGLDQGGGGGTVISTTARPRTGGVSPRSATGAPPLVLSSPAQFPGPGSSAMQRATADARRAATPARGDRLITGPGVGGPSQIQTAGVAAALPAVAGVASRAARAALRSDLGRRAIRTTSGLLGLGAAADFADDLISAVPARGDDMTMALPGGAPIPTAGRAGGVFGRAGGGTRVSMRKLVPVMTPAGNVTFYRHVGQPVVFSGDAALLKSTRKRCRKALSSAGGR